MSREPALGAVSDDDAQGRRHALGRAGERLAAEYLEQHGVAVLQRNWRCPHGELDLVGTDGHKVVFCEVKTRSGVDYGGPKEAVSADKCQRLRTLAQTWLGEWGLAGCQVRFDIVSVLWPPGGPVRIEHLKEVL